jgi:hypothetical protein
MSDSTEVKEFSTGAIRSSDRSHLDFTSMPLIGLIGVAKTAEEGAAKYGRYNYMKGMPVPDLINHGLGHWIMYLLGDRSEPHLEHAAWAGLAAVQSSVLDPELSIEHLLGPGATLPPEMVAFLAANDGELAANRGVNKGIGQWDMKDIPEIATLLGQRAAINNPAYVTLTPEVEAEISTALSAGTVAIDSEVVPKVKQKRRTKAEMALARGEAPPVDPSAIVPPDEEEPTVNFDAPPEPEPEAVPVVVAEPEVAPVDDELNGL